MIYTCKEIFEQSKELILKYKLFFIEDIISYLPCRKPTFYDKIKIDSDEMNILKGMLDANKIELKVSLRKKWFVSDNATLQMALMKLLSTEKEHKKLAMNYITSKNKNKNKNENINEIDISKLSTETLRELADAEIKQE